MVDSSERAPATPTPLSVWPVAIGGVAGILLGLFLGDYAHIFRPIGQVYVMLLEVAVYPYLICSLLHGLGSMSPTQARMLFLVGWKFYVGLWLITFALLILLAQGIPQAFPTSWVADRSVTDSPSLLEIIIPSDPFTALSRNYVPAVVLFCQFRLKLHIRRSLAIRAREDVSACRSGRNSSGQPEVLERSSAFRALGRFCSFC